MMRVGENPLWAPFSIVRGALGGGIRDGSHEPSFCKAAGALIDEHADLAAAFDCICSPQIIRPKHCKYVIVQSGDYPIEKPFAGIDEMPYYTASRISMQLYAAAHGYSYLYVDLRERGVGVDRAAAWMKLPLVSVLSRFFDSVFVVDPDIGPGRNFTTPLRWMADHIPRGSGRSFVFAGNAPSPPGGPCTGAMLVKSGVSNETARLLEYWWRLPDVSDEFRDYKSKHVWEQQVIDRLVRRKAEFAGNITVVLQPRLMGNPDSPFMQHFWSDAAQSGAERHRKVQRGLLEAVAHSVTTCGGEPRCTALVTSLASWHHFSPAVRWAELYPAQLNWDFWFGNLAQAAASGKA